MGVGFDGALSGCDYLNAVEHATASETDDLDLDAPRQQSGGMAIADYLQP